MSSVSIPRWILDELASSVEEWENSRDSIEGVRRDVLKSAQNVLDAATEQELAAVAPESLQRDQQQRRAESLNHAIDLARLQGASRPTADFVVEVANQFHQFVQQGTTNNTKEN